MKTIACFAALVAAAIAAPAFAGGASAGHGAAGHGGSAIALSADGRSAKVAYSPRALTSAEGAEAVLWRIEAAAQRVCRDREHGVGGLRTVAACRSRAVAAAVAAIDAPVLTAALRGGAAAAPFAVAARW